MPIFPHLNDHAKDDSRRLKMLRFSYDLLGDLLRMDGTTSYRITGLPADARLFDFSSDVFCASHQLCCKVWSSTFPPVPEGQHLGELTLDVHYFAWRDELKRLVDWIPDLETAVPATIARSLDAACGPADPYLPKKSILGDDAPLWASSTTR